MRRLAHRHRHAAAAILILLALTMAGCQTLVTRRDPPSAFPTPITRAVERATSLARASATSPSSPMATPWPPTPTSMPTPTRTPGRTPTHTSLPTRAVTTPTATQPAAPLLLAPDDGATGRILELRWEWAGHLGENEWFQVSIRPDVSKADPRPLALLRETSVRITGAHLLPGRYRWRVTVVRSPAGDLATAQPIGPSSDERTFALERPRTVVIRPDGATP